MNKEQFEGDYQVKDKISLVKSIVVYNDDVNSFDHVIECFISILEIGQEDAIKFTLKVHYEGKCAVKTGSYKELEPYALSLMNNKLSCKIE